jgi:hypothetical protein
MPLVRTENMVEQPSPKVEEINQKTDKNSLYLPTTKLPSDFKPYPKGVRVTYRRYGWMEVKYLSQDPSVIPDIDKYTMALNGIQVIGMDKEDLTISDFLYLELMRKISTLNPPYFEMSYICPSCKQMSVMTLEPSQISFADFTPPALPVKATLSFGVMEFMPLTIGKHRKLLDIKVPELFASLSIMAMCCTSHPYEEAYRLLIEACNIQDIAVIEEVDKILDHGLEPVKNICNNQIATYNEVDGITYTDVMEAWQNGDTSKVKGYMDQKSWKLQGELTDWEVESFLTDMGVIVNSRCDFEATVNLERGEGFALPFRFTRGDVLNAISFGDTSLTASSLP